MAAHLQRELRSGNNAVRREVRITSGSQSSLNKSDTLDSSHAGVRIRLKERPPASSLSIGSSHTRSGTHQGSLCVTVAKSDPHKTKKTNSSSGRNASSGQDLLSKNHIQIYSQFFDDIIQQNSTYGGLLISVKQKYDDYLNQLWQANQNLTDQLQNSSQRHVKQTQAQVLQEFNSLQQDVAEKDAYIAQLEEEIKQLQAQTLAGSEKTTKSLANELKSSRRREAKYVKLVTALRDRGYPVEEVYNSQVKRGGRRCAPSSAETSLEPRRDSSVPKLALNRRETTEFHAEFMSKLDEFSESWRDQLNAQKRC